MAVVESGCGLAVRLPARHPTVPAVATANATAAITHTRRVRFPGGVFGRLMIVMVPGPYQGSVKAPSKGHGSHDGYWFARMTCLSMNVAAFAECQGQQFTWPTMVDTGDQRDPSHTLV